MVQKSSVSN